jgi:hypothetical protein
MLVRVALHIVINGFAGTIIRICASAQVGGERATSRVSPAQAKFAEGDLQTELVCAQMQDGFPPPQVEAWQRKGGKIVTAAAFSGHVAVLESPLGVGADYGPRSVQARLAIRPVLNTDEVIFQDADLKPFPALSGEGQGMRSRINQGHVRWLCDAHRSSASVRIARARGPDPE